MRRIKEFTDRPEGTYWPVVTIPIHRGNSYFAIGIRYQAVSLWEDDQGRQFLKAYLRTYNNKPIVDADGDEMPPVDIPWPLCVPTSLSETNHNKGEEK